MPLYEYKCEKCGAKFEDLQSSGSTKKPPCPSCKGTAVAKQFSAFAITNQPEQAACGEGGCGRCSESPGCPFSGMDD